MHRMQNHGYIYSQRHIYPQQTPTRDERKPPRRLEESGIFFSLLDAREKSMRQNLRFSAKRTGRCGSRCACGQWNYPALASFGTGEKGPLPYPPSSTCHTKPTKPKELQQCVELPKFLSCLGSEPLISCDRELFPSCTEYLSLFCFPASGYWVVHLYAIRHLGPLQYSAPVSREGKRTRRRRKKRREKEGEKKGNKNRGPPREKAPPPARCGLVAGM